jgi:signal transduction histidine kinase/ligand-binding sensor domain-containing protein
MTWKAHLLLLLCFIWPARSSCEQQSFRAWTTDDGLPQNIVRDVYQTPDHYLWIATLDGLARFDGVRFTVYNTANTPGMVSNRLLGMLGTAAGDLWIPTESGDLMRYRMGKFETLGPAQGVLRKAVRGVAQGEDGRIWILQDNAVYEWRPENQRFVNIMPRDFQARFDSLRWDRLGFWGRENDVLHCFRNGEFKSYSLPPQIHNRSLWRVAAAPNGDIWFETQNRDQYRISAGHPPTRIASPEQAHTVFVDSGGISWKIHINPELDRSLEYSANRGTEFLAFSGFYVDHEGNRWIRTEGQGLFQFQKHFIQVYSKKQGLAATNIYPIYQDHNGAIWLGAWNSGLSRFQDGKFTNYTIADGLPSELITALFEDRDGHLWIGSHDGLGIYENHRFQNARGPVLAEGEPVQAISQDRSGTLWFGMRSGLFSYKDGVSRHYSETDGLATNDTHVIIEDRTGDLLIGGYGGLTRLHNGAFTRIWSAGGPASLDIRALYEDPDGVLWIGTYESGLARYAEGRITRFTSKDGLFNNGVFQILPDRQGNFWISSNRGIYRVREAELNEFAKGLRKYISSVPYGKADGLENEECNGGLWPAGIRTRNGELWFPTQAGVAVIRPNTLVNDRQPSPVMLEDVLLDNVPVPIHDTLRVDPGKKYIEIHYTSPSFVRPAQVRFRYKLDGLDSDWVEAGRRRTAYYSHVPPGNYTFSVIAGNNEGNWSPEGAPLSITVIAPYYLTWWFRTLLVLAAVALIAFAWRYRTSQLRQAQAMQQAFSQQLIASQENERKRIAAELHDSIGQSLVVIKNLVLFVLQPRKGSVLSDEAETMEAIVQEVSRSIEESKRISYNLRPFQLDRLGLKKAIEALVRSVSTASGIRYTCEIDDVDTAFAEDLRINFYRIVQESLGNIMKHSQATEVQIQIRKTDERVSLTISDNGRGFNPSDAPPQPGKGGFGLTGMSERAHLMGGHFKIQSAPGRGTVLFVEIPLKGEVHE